MGLVSMLRISIEFRKIPIFSIRKKTNLDNFRANNLLQMVLWIFVNALRIFALLQVANQKIYVNFRNFFAIKFLREITNILQIRIIKIRILNMIGMRFANRLSDLAGSQTRLDIYIWYIRNRIQKIPRFWAFHFIISSHPDIHIFFFVHTHFMIYDTCNM